LVIHYVYKTYSTQHTKHWQHRITKHLVYYSYEDKNVQLFAESPRNYQK